MPSVSEQQRRFMGVELEKARRGGPTDTGMPKDKLREFARKPVARSGGSRRSRRRR